MADMQGIGGRVRDLRIAAGLTQRQLDQLSGIDQGQISKIELMAIVQPRARTVAALALALGVTVETLTGGADRVVDEDYWKELRKQTSRLTSQNQAMLLSLVRQLGTERVPPTTAPPRASAPPRLRAGSGSQRPPLKQSPRRAASRSS